MDPASIVGLVAAVASIVTKAGRMITELRGLGQEDDLRKKQLKEVEAVWYALQGLEKVSSELLLSGEPDEGWVETLRPLNEQDGTLDQIRNELDELDRTLPPRSGRMAKIKAPIAQYLDKQEIQQRVDRLSRLKLTVTMVMSASSTRVGQMARVSIGEAKKMLEPGHFKAVLTWLSPLTPRQKQKEVLGSADPYSWVFGSAKFKTWQEGDTRTLWCYGAPGAGKSVLAASAYAQMAEQYRGQKADVRVAAFLLSDARRLFSQGLYLLGQLWELRDDATALHVAAHLSLAGVVSQLLAKGEAIDSQEHLGRTPLMCALNPPSGFCANSAATVECLLSAGANVSVVCKRGSTALTRAMKRQQGEIVERLLQLPNVGINATPYDTAPALSSAIRKSNKSVVQKILARPDLDVNLVDPADGFTALHHAIVENDLETFDTLVSREDLALDTADRFLAQTPLTLAADFGFTKGVGTLIDKGANIYHLDYQQGTALMCAAGSNNADVVRLLMSRGADIHQRDCFGRTVLHSASAGDAWTALEVLLSSRDIDIDCQGEHGETALHDACKSSDATGARMLVAGGARCDIRDSQGLTPVDIAAGNGRDEIVEVLKTSSAHKGTALDGGNKSFCEAARVDAPETLRSRIAAASVDEINTADTPYSGTPLAVACEFDRPDVAAMLLDAGADPDKADGFNRTPCSRALTRGSTACLEALLSHGADIDHLPGEDHPLWVRAVRRGRCEVALWLLRHGARARRGDARPGDLQQALCAAIKHDDALTARRLVEAGASLDVKYEGYPAAELAQRLGSEAVASYFAGLPSLALVNGDGDGVPPEGPAVELHETGGPCGKTPDDAGHVDEPAKEAITPDRAAQDGPNPRQGPAVPGLAELRRMLPVALFLLVLAVLKASRSALTYKQGLLRPAETPGSTAGTAGTPHLQFDER